MRYIFLLAEDKMPHCQQAAAVVVCRRGPHHFNQNMRKSCESFPQTVTLRHDATTVIVLPQDGGTHKAVAEFICRLTLGYDDDRAVLTPTDLVKIKAISCSLHHFRSYL